LYDNEPEDETELGFVVGDTLEILTKDDSGWWEARLNGKVGSIPANYVEIISS
jgi:son of sevenless-like protein